MFQGWHGVTASEMKIHLYYIINWELVHFDSKYELQVHEFSVFLFQNT